MNVCFRLTVAVLLAIGLTAILMTQVADLTADVIDDAETVIEAGSEGLTTTSIAYGAKNTDGARCTGPKVNCASGPSPDCDTGPCQAITTLTVPTCQTSTAWIGEFHCYQNGMECENGTCPDGFMCFNSVEGACTADWWWF